MLKMENFRTDDTQSLLTYIDLFQGLNPAELARIGKHAHRRVSPSGTDIITAEQPGEVVYLILSGTVKIHMEQMDGRDVILAILGPGDTVGEMSLVDSAGRSASAVTLEDSILLWMDSKAFRLCLEEFPQVSLNLVRILSARVRLANELIQALTTLDVNGRVARQLLAFADKYGQENEMGETRIPIRLTQSDIADLVGASRKRVNQAITLFKQQDLVAMTEKGRIKVCDRDSLANYC